MPEYHQFQCYVPAEDGKEIFPLFYNWLQKRPNAPPLDKWYTDVYWDEEAEQWYQNESPPSWDIPFGDAPLQIKPHFMTWSPEVILGLDQAWLELGICMQSSDLLNTDDTIRPTLLPFLEELMVSLFDALQTEVFLTDEVFDGIPWEALIRGQKSWDFILAILQPTHLLYSESLPENYEKKSLQNNALLIRNRNVIPSQTAGSD